jgi:hypothetical protein
METRYPSPDGNYVFHIFPWEAHMSLWIESPELVDIQSGQCLWRPNDSNWSLNDAEWLNDTTVQVSLRKYPGNHHPSSLQAIIDCRQMTASLMAAPAIPLNKLESALESSLTRVAE